MHYCENVYCGQKSGYWVEGDDGRKMLDGAEAAKYWREDHNPVTCALHGGDCVGAQGTWSSIEAHEKSERDHWTRAVNKAAKYGWLGQDTPYWEKQWERNKYCREAIQALDRD
jgi:hypothetical protein